MHNIECYCCNYTICLLVTVTSSGTALTTILPILFLYLNTVTMTAGTFEP